jgi:hypothetical protein
MACDALATAVTVSINTLPVLPAPAPLMRASARRRWALTRDVAASLNILGTVYREQGRYAEAEPLDLSLSRTGAKEDIGLAGTKEAPKVGGFCGVGREDNGGAEQRSNRPPQPKAPAVATEQPGRPTSLACRRRGRILSAPEQCREPLALATEAASLLIPSTDRGC